MNQKNEEVDLDDLFAQVTPLEAAVGFQVAEETYDLLNIREQVIVDLLCAGFTHAEIGAVFNVSQPSISSSIRRIRFKLAESKLKLVLDTRVHFRYDINGRRNG